MQKHVCFRTSDVEIQYTMETVRCRLEKARPRRPRAALGGGPVGEGGSCFGVGRVGTSEA